MSNVAHTDKNLDLNEEGEVLATVGNMEEYAAQEHHGRLIVWSPQTGEQFSATPGDYFAGESGEPLRDGMGDEMILAYITPENVRPVRITEEEHTDAGIAACLADEEDVRALDTIHVYVADQIQKTGAVDAGLIEVVLRALDASGRKY